MNREQKRRAIKDGEMMHITEVDRLLKAKNDSMMHITEVDRLLRQTGYSMLKKAVNDYSAVVDLNLRDKLGFGTKRTADFLESVGTMFDDIQTVS